MKVGLIGRHDSAAAILAYQLGTYAPETIEASLVEPTKPWHIPGRFRDLRFDIVHGIGAWGAWATLPWFKLKNADTKAILHFVGTDAVLYSERSLVTWKWMPSIRCADLVLFCGEHLRQMTHIKGEVWPLPVTDGLFRDEPDRKPERDILYYCGLGPGIYRLKDFTTYAREHPQTTFTLLIRDPRDLGGFEIPPNVDVATGVRHDEMPRLYRAHRKMMRWTIHDGVPKMVYEAVLCGLEVDFNGRSITSVPDEMLASKAIPKLVKMYERLLACAT